MKVIYLVIYSHYNIRWQPYHNPIITGLLFFYFYEIRIWNLTNNNNNNKVQCYNITWCHFNFRCQSRNITAACLWLFSTRNIKSPALQNLSLQDSQYWTLIPALSAPDMVVSLVFFTCNFQTAHMFKIFFTNFEFSVKPQ